MKLSVFYDHILQAAEQTGKNVPELLAEAKNAGIDAVEINMTYLTFSQHPGHIPSSYALLPPKEIPVLRVFFLLLPSVPFQDAFSPFLSPHACPSHRTRRRS